VGGEGFIMQKLSGRGLAFIEIDGSAVEYDLAAGQEMIVDTGYLAMMDASVTMEVTKIKGIKNALFGGEGLFNTFVTGPGRVLIQTMPLSGFAQFVANLLPKKS
jgi:uncharacterized protein (AIM24 family)